MESAFGILASRFRALLGTMEQRSKVVRDIVLTCVMLYNMLYQGIVGRAPTQADGDATILNEAAVYVPDKNNRNLL